jgi:cytochrome c oxidase assembly protein subunit 15
MVLIVLEGAVVRATGSGAGCGQHWPLCNGQIIPHHPRIATIIEFTHRSLTGICSTFVVVLIAWVFVANVRGTRVRKAAVASGILLVTEALLGAVLVLGGYVEHNTSNARVFVQCIHFTNTMLLLAALALTWWWSRARAAVTIKKPAQAQAWTVLIATIIVGATGSVAALADTLFPSPSLVAGIRDDFAATAPLLVRMRWMHPAATLLELIFVIWLCTRVSGTIARWVLWLLAAQILFGIVDVLLLAPISMQVIHLAGADAFWIALVILAAEVITAPKINSTSL